MKTGPIGILDTTFLKSKMNKVWQNKEDLGIFTM